MFRFIYFEYLCYINSTTLLLNIFCIKSESELFLNIRDQIKRKKKFNFPKSYVAWNIGFEQQGQSINLTEPISNFDSSLTCRLSKILTARHQSNSLLSQSYYKHYVVIICRILKFLVVAVAGNRVNTELSPISRVKHNLKLN